jgi:3-deoxy-D-manno-octulosonic-acid transferase
MRLLIALSLYRLLLPLLFIAAFPGWIVKMLRRGGIGTQLAERVGIYTCPADQEPCGAVHFHAVSVGEAILALKLIREWQLTSPNRRFVLATGTATGHALASAAQIPGLRVTYAPLDFPWMLRRYLSRFEPSQIVLIEAEIWPLLLLTCQRRKIPVRLVNARMSPRSARRFRRFATWLQPIFRLLDCVATQEPADTEIWLALGLPPHKIHTTGSLKFDPSCGPQPTQRPAFQALLDSFGRNRPIILAASTHPGEEALIANAIHRAAPNALALIAPRHAERRSTVVSDLEKIGLHPILRSKPPAQFPSTILCFVIDTTGELCDWTAHADAVIIGKSFLSTGGQNPCEAILASKPVIFGPHMENFQPLASQLLLAGGARSAHDLESLSAAIRCAIDPKLNGEITQIASSLLARHHGATQRILALLTA